MLRALTLLSVLAPVWGAADGAKVFATYCAVCHKEQGDNVAGRAMTVSALKTRSRATILKALDGGVMTTQGAMLTAEERIAVAAFLGTAATAGAPAARMCAVSKPMGPIDVQGAAWNGWGLDLDNTRFQPNPGFTAADIPKLKLKWAFGLPNADSAQSQPVIAGGRLFYGSPDGTVFALDAGTGCAYWTFSATTTVRSAVVLAKAGKRTLAMFGDIDSNAYALDAESGALVWKKKIEDHRASRITGSPVFHAGVVYFPVASVEEVAAGAPNYACCTFRGSVVAMEAETGRQVWKSYTIPDPPARRGKTIGPSGAGVWSAPTIDAGRGVLYVGTGDGYSDPPSLTSDAVVAFDLKTGSMKWSKQLTPGDSWNYSCASPDRANCPEKPGDDLDIGSSPILRRVGDKTLLLVGQKSGVMHALDPDKRGDIVWQTRIGAGSAIGGIMWGSAADADRVYIPLSDLFVRRRTTPPGGVFALEIASGKLIWRTPAPESACKGKPGCSQAQIAAASAMPGAVFSGSMDGHLRAYSSADGRILWDFDTLQDFETVNGIPAKGGSLSAAGPAIAGGMVFVNSGYGSLAGMPGNVLLAFAPERD